MIAVWALAAFVGVIVAWNAVLKRNIGEAMIVGFLAVAGFALAGGVSPAAIGEAVLDSMQEEVTFAGLAFVFMSYLLVKTPVLDRLIDLLNSVLGRLRGGPVFTATVAGGIFGAIAHVGVAVTAAVGSVTVPWMKRSGVRPELAATIVAGGAGMGVSFPFSATMFILVGGLAAQGVMQPDEIVLPLALAGLWCLGYRLVLAWYLVRNEGIEPIAPEHRLPFGASLRSGWTSLLLFLPILVPLLLTRGPVAAALGAHSGVGEAIAVPLTASATMAAVGPVAVVALVGAGIPAPVAAAAVLIFASTEGRLPAVGRSDLRRVGHRPRRPGEDVRPAAQVLLPAHPRHGRPDRRRRAAGLTATHPQEL